MKSLCLTAVALVAFASLSCTPTAPTGGDTTIINTNTNNSGGGPTASPSPGSGSGDLPPGSILRIGLFGQSPNPGPPNGARQIVVGNTGFITATPKDANGNDIPAAVHGPNIAWSVTHGGGIVQISVPTEPFNRDVKCLNVGVFGLSATVKNVTGTADFECVRTASGSLRHSQSCATCDSPPPYTGGGGSSGGGSGGGW